VRIKTSLGAPLSSVASAAHDGEARRTTGRRGKDRVGQPERGEASRALRASPASRLILHVGRGRTRERTVLWTPWLLYSRRHPTQQPFQYLAYVRGSFCSLLPPVCLCSRGAAGSRQQATTGTSTHPCVRLRSSIILVFNSYC